MAKKGPNSKAEAANARKAASKAEKDRKAAEAAEAAESSKWAEGAKKNKKEEQEAKKAAAAAKKAEAARLLAEEEKEFKKKPTLKGVDKKAAQKSAKNEAAGHARRVIPEFSASGIDDALDLLSLNDKSVKSKDIEKHPERRFKAALAAFEERELPRFKAENPGLRLSQLKDLIYKAFQKSPENPFNQANVVAYNATIEEAQQAKSQRNKAIENRLRTN
ncbi:uncharacterized protein BX663DRAFT_483509 [Cokeromyces recurvatus]|uniref:uncharacterized protein n=1 Tax=Cokeromyces recurvatus TaxID=90255 RepID=UPI00221F3667|nr:uncharacterized protein BX663DRAFT_483509 [Cokeromyces recurvatus]KAI7905822.1 hypothetical protein BX663DRAFT_483509 [Cokeromyces recurvatus]